MSSASKYRKKAVEYEQLKQFDRAVASYIRAIEENENANEEVDVALFNKVGDLTLRGGRVSEAVTYYERAVEHYVNNNLFDNAIALCNKILRNAPGRSNVYFTLGRICGRKGLRSDATRNFLEYATRMQQEGRVDEGMRALAEVAELMPELTEVGRLVQEHAARAGITLTPRRRATPLESKAQAEPEPSRMFGMSKDLVFLEIDYESQQARAKTPPIQRVVEPESAPLVAAAPAATPVQQSAVPTPTAARTPRLEDLMIFDPAMSAPQGADASIDETPSVVDPTPILQPFADASAPVASLSDMQPTEVVSDALIASVVDAVVPVTIMTPVVVTPVLVTPVAVTPATVAPIVMTPVLATPASVEPVVLTPEFATPVIVDVTADVMPEAELEPESFPVESIDIDHVVLDDVVDEQNAVEQVPAEADIVGQADAEPVDSIDVINAIIDDEPGIFGNVLVEAVSDEVVDFTPSYDELTYEPNAEAFEAFDSAFTLPETVEPSVTEPVTPYEDVSLTLTVEQELETVIPAALLDGFTAEEVEAPESIVTATGDNTDPAFIVIADDEFDAVAEPDSFASLDFDAMLELEPAEFTPASISPVALPPIDAFPVALATDDMAPFAEPSVVLPSLEGLDLDTLEFESADEPFDATDAGTIVTTADPVVVEAIADLLPEETQSLDEFDTTDFDVLTPPRARAAQATLPDEFDAEVELPSMVGLPVGLAPDFDAAADVDVDVDVDGHADAGYRVSSDADILDDLFIDADVPTAVAAAEATIVASSRCAELQGASDADPNNFVLRRRLAEALLEGGNRVDALKELGAALAIAELAGNLPDALGIADELVRVDSDQVAHHQKRLELAIRLADQARLREAYLDFADTLLRQGEELRARAVFARVLEIDPWDDRARAALGDAAPPPPPRPPTPGTDDSHVNLADWLRDEDEPASTRMRMREPDITGDEQDDFNSLLKQFKEGVARSLGEDDYESHYDLGVAYKEMGLLDDAIGEFQMALRSRNNRLAAYEALGQCFLEQQSYKVAVTVLSRALHEPAIQDEQRVGVLYLLGYSCEVLQRFDEARGYFQRVYATDIHFRDVAQRLAALDRTVR